MQLHQHGVDLVVTLLDAADQIEKLSQSELQNLLREAADVMADLLKRDVPEALGGRKVELPPAPSE
ncbi:hypothetical protein ASD64_20110 [Mesorhizobium sp. Root157]|uniref:hypothetical protein n=1 Tax=Mesorhizobium sp. Root157 TaxID=1736477 RepID=UPI0007008B7F|nr:hypothetical protein [Mesorhizobium sp. Root157]KQZ84813.1 hypothetical protein ASD64_20110 [Mesorhizobium sp. Root157]